MSFSAKNLSSSVLKYYGLNSPNIIKDFSVHKHYFKKESEPSGLPTGVSFGVEVEIEKCSPDSDIVHPLWSRDEDGSLKDHGLEYISCPIDGHNWGMAFDELEAIFKANKNSVFSGNSHSFDDCREINFLCKSHLFVRSYL